MTISPVEVATSRDVISHVTYSVANLKPTFLVRASTPVPKPKSESIPAEPVPSIPSMPAQIEDPAAAEQTQTVAPAAPVAAQQTQTATPAAPVATQQTQTVTPAAPVTTPQTQTATPAAPVTTQGTQTPNITELTPATQSPASQATQDSAASVITDLTSSAPQT